MNSAHRLTRSQAQITVAVSDFDRFNLKYTMYSTPLRNVCSVHRNRNLVTLFVEKCRIIIRNSVNWRRRRRVFFRCSIFDVRRSAFGVRRLAFGVRRSAFGVPSVFGGHSCHVSTFVIPLEFWLRGWTTHTRLLHSARDECHT